MRMLDSKLLQKAFMPGTAAPLFVFDVCIMRQIMFPLPKPQALTQEIWQNSPEKTPGIDYGDTQASGGSLTHGAHEVPLPPAALSNGAQLPQRKIGKPGKSRCDFEKGFPPQQIFSFGNLKGRGEDREVAVGSKMRPRTIWALSSLPHLEIEPAAQRLLTHTCDTPSSNSPWSSSDVASQNSTNDDRKGSSMLQGSPLFLCHWLQRGHAVGCLGLLVALASKISIKTGESTTLQGIPLISGGYFQHVGPKVIKIGSTALRLNQQCSFRRILFGNLFASSGNTGKWERDYIRLQKSDWCEKKSE